MQALTELLAARGHAWTIEERRNPTHATPFDATRSLLRITPTPPPGYVPRAEGDHTHDLKIDWSNRTITIEECEDKGSFWCTVVDVQFDDATLARFAALEWPQH